MCCSPCCILRYLTITLHFNVTFIQKIWPGAVSSVGHTFFKEQLDLQWRIAARMQNCPLQTFRPATFAKVSINQLNFEWETIKFKMHPPRCKCNPISKLFCYTWTINSKIHLHLQLPQFTWRCTFNEELQNCKLLGQLPLQKFQLFFYWETINS